MTYRVAPDDIPLVGHQIGETGLGNPASSILALGPVNNYIFPELTPADANKETRGLILTIPSAGVFSADEFGVFTFSGTGPGYYPFTWQLYFDGQPSGPVRTYFINVGNLVGQVVSQILNGASSPSDNADYKLLSANDQRQFILKVPGSGPIRGVHIYKDVVYAFRDNAAGTAGNIYKATAAGWVQVAVGAARLPGGKLELINANFTGSTLTQKVYGCDGVNKAFAFDGVTYSPITTGMAVDAPSHLAFHRNFLFLSFLGSVQLSVIGNPFSWITNVGAGEITTGEEVTAMLPQSGNQVGASMAIFTRGKTSVLYGAGASTFQLIQSVHDLGYSPGTVQAVSNNTFGLTARGIQALTTTQAYGNFSFASVSFLVQSLVNAKSGMETVATTSRTKNQYRLYYSDGTALTVGLTGDKINGILPLNYGRAVRCICTSTLTNGKEMTVFGSDDGYVYQDSTGTSFDGQPIEAWIRPAFNNLKSPRVRKRYRRAVFEVHCDGFSKVNATYDLGYANPGVSPAAVQRDITMLGAGGYWGQFTWGQFTWASPVYATPQISIEGTEKNISFLFYSSRAQDNSHVISGVSLHYSIRRAER